MKNHLMGAVVCAAIASPLAAQAEGNIYGQFNLSANEIDGAFTNLNGSTAGMQDGQSSDNNGSRLGFQGENGQFFYAVELNLGVDDDASGLGSTRHAFIGFNSSVGTFIFGRTNSAYKLAGQRLDPFYDTSAVNFAGIAQNEGGSYGQSNLVNGWTDSSIAYVSPEVGGLTVNAGVFLQEASDEDHDMAIGLDFRAGELGLGLQYIAVGADNSAGVVAGSGTVVDSALQLSASYEQKGWSVGASYELVDLRSGDDRNYLFIGGDFALNEHTKLAASYGTVDQGLGEGMGFTVGAFVDLMKDFTVYGLYSQSDLDNAPAAEASVFSLGVKYAFQI